jgi:hypothetical protein
MPTISNSPRVRAAVRRDQAGSALLIVLAFVVLMTGLILAFFSRSILEQQVSVGSANQVKVDNLMMGAVAATVSDLKGEIEGGSSNPVFPVSGNLGIYYFPPAVSSGTYPSMLPAVTGNTTTGGAPGSTFGGNKLAQGALLNLIKISQHAQYLYPLGQSAWAADPTTNDVKRAAAVSTGQTGNADGIVASGSADGTSPNGRYVSGTRWNKPLFTTLTTAFPLPDWIYVPRVIGGGTVANPTTFNANMITSPSNLGSPTTVVGRYAYAIYDEGGLLDINVAGVPTPIAPTNPATAVSSSYNPLYSAYKDSLAMADLTQIGLSQTQIDKIVGWRNYASASQSQNTAISTSPGYTGSGVYTWTGTSGFTSATNYWANVIVNPTGFLRPMTAWQATPTQTDQFFTSRQQLIQFFTQVLGGSTTVLSTLQYLTHFSRDINQPSYQPDPTRPSDLAVTAGGNDKGGGTEDNIGAATVIGTIAKTTVNPSFLSARVGMSSGPSPFVRNDGSRANSGDPLVKKRFALNRLAWLTFAGPIADDSGNLNPSKFPDGTTIPSSVQTQVGTIISQLENTYGFTPAFLATGGPTNIQKYFGLVWVLDNSTTIGINDGTYKWKYEHGTKVSGAGVAGNSTTPGPICTLGYVASAGRDPDFFELLKTSIAVGSIAKAATVLNTTTTVAGQQGPVNSPWGYQAQKDTSVDAYIIQLSANIIDQFSTDNYSRRILFDDGTWGPVATPVVQEYRGVEDLPYLYRLRGTHIKLTDSSPAESQALQSGSPPTNYTSATAGTGTFMEIPEIFDPYTWNPSATVSTIRPTSFQLIPLSADPSNFNAGTTTNLGNTQPVPYSRNNGVSEGEAPAAPSYPSPFTINGEALTFSIPATTVGVSFFREPTLLNKPDPSAGAATDAGPPRGSNVTSSGSNSAGYSNAPITSYYQAAAYLDKTTGATTATPFPTSIANLSDNQKYLGFSFGTVPLWFPQTGSSFSTAVMTGGVNFSGSGNSYFTYQMQYQDPISTTVKWDTYDEKFLPLSYAPPAGGGLGMNTQVNAFLSGTQNSVAYGKSNGTNDPTGDNSHFDLIQGDQYEVVLDPRTARFSTYVYEGGQTTGAFWPPPLSHDTSAWCQWVDASQNAIMTARPDYNVGWNIINPPVGLGFSNPAGVNPTNIDNGSTTAIGGYSALLSQNSMSTESTSSNVNLSTVSSQSAGASTTKPQYYYDPDGVVRRATAGYSAASATPESMTVTYVGSLAPATVKAATQPGAYNGLPLQTSTMYTAGAATPITYSSRPVMLHRPFRSVADLGYVFSGTPWKNIDFSTPESGYSALLDAFCVNDTDDPNGLVAGKVNLNTRQSLVLQAILAGAYKDEFNPATTLISAADATKLITDTSNGLTTRTASTSSGKGPLTNIGDLVGKWISGTSTTAPVNGSTAYSGFSGDLNNFTTTTDTSSPYAYQVQRFREAAIRALANTGQTRVWNLMIDLVAQTGRFPASDAGLPATAASLANFYVEGEQRYWVHLAIDRCTGQVIDQQIEVVKE